MLLRPPCLGGGAGPGGQALLGSGGPPAGFLPQRPREALLVGVLGATDSLSEGSVLTYGNDGGGYFAIQ